MAAIVVVAGVSVYILTLPPPIPLAIRDGSTTGVVEGNFANHSSISGLWGFFNATTYANQSSGPTSTLTLHLRTYAFSALGSVQIDIGPTVEGRFASNLRLTGITLAYNETGSCIGANGAAFPNQYNPVNVSFNPASIPGFNISGPGGDNLTTTPVNQTRHGPFYEFVYPSEFTVTPCFGTDHFLAFRATVTGSFTPSVSVGIRLQVIDVPA